jgi:hypothetical protein
MDKLKKYQDTIEKVLLEYASIPYVNGDFKTEVVFDKERHRYLLVNVGWNGNHRVHGCIIHLDIIDEKIWIQRDGTENGIALDLEEAGISKKDIVLGFREPELRHYTGYAIA